MTDTPKAKKDAALERIRELAAKRAATNPSPGDNQGVSPDGRPKRGGKSTGPGHRPQGG
ncbi:MAG: hypothetical protein QOD65_1871 [Gaiellales bacterium]|jgi:hypothetical protein|nr:hypothetical protein [Gaiellales bacterium]MEA2171272.1 hypothetical protein [Solirubrobacteraceae bacterium]